MGCAASPEDDREPARHPRFRFTRPGRRVRRRAGPRSRPQEPGAEHLGQAQPARRTGRCRRASATRPRWPTTRRPGRVIRWGGHNQGGGGEQNAETWTFDPRHREVGAEGAEHRRRRASAAPSRTCSTRISGRYVRFPAFSGSHGWHWFRENYLSNSSVWTYDLADQHLARPAAGPGPARRPAAVRVVGQRPSGGGRLRRRGEPRGHAGLRPVHEHLDADEAEGASRTRAAAATWPTTPRDKLHVLFGTQFGDDPHTWTYDLRKNEWRGHEAAIQPPTDRNDAVLAYDANGRSGRSPSSGPSTRSRKDEVAAGHLETWAFDAATNTWTKLKPPREPDGLGQPPADHGRRAGPERDPDGGRTSTRPRG